MYRCSSIYMYIWVSIYMYVFMYMYSTYMHSSSMLCQTHKGVSYYRGGLVSRLSVHPNASGMKC